MPIGTFTAVLHKEGDLYVADCPEVGTVSQGKTVEEAIANLKEATELYMEEFFGRWSPSSRRAMPRLPRVSGAEVIRALERRASLRFDNAGITLCLSALDQTESPAALSPCIRNLPSAHCAES